MPPAPNVTVSLSGGGYRAAAFGAGALLALSDSTLRPHVASVSSVSGGSMASALTIGGFAARTAEDPDPMAARVRRLAGLTQSSVVATESFLRWRQAPLPVLAACLACVFAWPGFARGDAGDAAFFVLLVFGAPGFMLASAIPNSLYAVRATMEAFLAPLVAASDPSAGPTLADAAGRETVRRVYCATDLTHGSHVYLSADAVLSPDVAGGRPRVPIADVVAASAGFPGFRPLVFGPGELGEDGVEPDGVAARERRMLGRFLVGALGVTGLAVAATAVVARVVGLADGSEGLGLSTLAVVAGAVVARGCASRLAAPDGVGLIDGGVYDNLGAAFSLVTDDRRYPGLEDQLGVHGGGILLVVDASKGLVAADPAPGKAGLGALVPLRLRAASRALEFVGGANATARRGVIAMVLARGEPFAGAVVSIGDVPRDAPGPADDWAAIVRINANTATTLDGLPEATIAALLLHGYYATEAAIADLGATMERRRSADEIADLAGPEALDDVRGVLAAGPSGPYGRHAAVVRRVSLAVYACFVVVALVLAAGWVG